MKIIFKHHAFYSKNQLLEIENNFFTSWLEMQKCQDLDDSKHSEERTDGGCKQHWETLRKGAGEMLETPDIVTKMKTVFDGLICRLDMAEERSSEIQSWVGHLHHHLPGSENIKEDGEERM